MEFLVLLPSFFMPSPPVSQFDQALKAYEYSLRCKLTSQAVFYGELLVALDPHSPVALGCLVQALLDQGEVVRALGVVKEVGADDEHLSYWKGLILFRLQK
jgi:hypothetical protein